MQSGGLPPPELRRYTRPPLLEYMVESKKTEGLAYRRPPAAIGPPLALPGCPPGPLWAPCLAPCLNPNPPAASACCIYCIIPIPPDQFFVLAQAAPLSSISLLIRVGVDVSVVVGVVVRV